MATLGMPLLGMGQETPTLTSLLTARREREKQSKLADLLANAYGTQDQAQRQKYVQEAIRTDPQAGLGLAKLLQPTAQEQFTLAPGSKRFGPDGRVIAEVPFAPSSAKIVSVPDGVGGTRQMLFDPRTQKFSNPSYGGEPQQGQWAQPGASYQTPSGVVRIDPNIDPADLGVVQADIANNAQANNYKLPDQIVGSPQGQMGYTPPKAAESYQTMTPAEVKALGLPDGTIAQRSPSGQVQIINKPRDLPSGGQVIDNGDGTTTYIPAGKVSEGERNAAGFYQRMVSANAEMQRLTDNGYDPSNRRDYYTAGGEILNPLATSEGRQFQQAKANWVRANLRKESGAAIGKSEMENEIANYFPIPGDDDATIAQKARNRRVVEQAMRTAAGAALAPMANRPAQAKAPQAGAKPAASGGPKPGTVESGYRFKGGNPADPNAWERI